MASCFRGVVCLRGGGFSAGCYEERKNVYFRIRPCYEEKKNVYFRIRICYEEKENCVFRARYCYEI